jgi:hypothetical protein
VLHDVGVDDVLALLLDRGADVAELLLAVVPGLINPRGLVDRVELVLPLLGIVLVGEVPGDPAIAES